MILLLACNGDGVVEDPVDSGDSGGVEGCHAGAPTGAHTVYVSFPYAADASQSDLWRRYTFDGELVEEEELELGRATGGRGAFTPDGAFAYLVDDEGGLHGPAGATTTPYISGVTIDRAGETAWLVDPNWPENGGGIYRAGIDCATGALSEPELVWKTKNAAAVVLRPGTRSEAAVIARELDGVPGAVHLVDLEAQGLLTSIDAFGDDEAIVADAAWDVEGERLLVSDNNGFSGVNRVAVVGEEGPREVLEVLDPVSLATSPFEEGPALAVSGYGDGVFELERTASAYALGDQVASLALPGSAVVVGRGELAGTVLVVENTGLWQLEFSGDGLVDRGRLVGWSGLDGIPGAIALSP